jgi:prolyl 4-hydroxylase
MLRKLIKRLRGAWKRRHYSLSRVFPIAPPPHNASWLPNGFAVTKLAETGLTLIDNFCTAVEAQLVIEAARDRLKRSGVLIDGKWVEHEGRISYTAQLYGPEHKNEVIFPLMQRAAMLTGVPYTHLEAVYVTRYTEGGLYNEHIDYGKEFKVDRLYTVLLYLNTVPDEQGGETVFPRLKVALQPQVGRAVTWTNKNPDGSGHLEYSHAALPVKKGGEKWVIQFWMRRYPMIKPIPSLATPQVNAGRPLAEDADLLAGIKRV